MNGWRKRPGLGWTIAALSTVMLLFSEPGIVGVVIYGSFIVVGVMLALGPSWGR